MDDERKRKLHTFYTGLYKLHVKYVGLSVADHERCAEYIDEVNDLINKQLADADPDDAEIFRDYIRAQIAGIEKRSYERGDIKNEVEV